MRPFGWVLLSLAWLAPEGCARPAAAPSSTAAPSAGVAPSAMASAAASPAAGGGPSLAVAVPESSAPSPASGESTVPRRAPLRYELNGHKFPLPLVHGTVEGEPVWMIVDTGANMHVVASWVARKVGLPMRRLGDVLSDHTGHPLKTSTVENPRLAIDDWGAVTAPTMLVTDFTEPLAKIGIGALVSPQWLAGERDAIVLDLPLGEMRQMPWEDASRALDDVGGREIAPAGVRLCQDSASAIKWLSFVVPATVDGRPVDLLLDTGAHRTDLLSSSKAARALAPKAKPSTENAYFLSGLVHTREVSAVPLRVGDWALRTDVDLVPGSPDATCPRDGALAMDALESCVLVLARKHLRGRCGI